SARRKPAGRYFACGNPPLWRQAQILSLTFPTVGGNCRNVFQVRTSRPRLEASSLEAQPVETSVKCAESAGSGVENLCIGDAAAGAMGQGQRGPHRGGHHVDQQKRFLLEWQIPQASIGGVPGQIGNNGLLEPLLSQIERMMAGVEQLGGGAQQYSAAPGDLPGERWIDRTGVAPFSDLDMRPADQLHHPRRKGEVLLRRQ